MKAARTHKGTDKHKRYETIRKANPTLRRSKQLRNSHRWQRFRKWFRQKYPLCCDPFGQHKLIGITAPTQQVHHIEPLSTLTDDEFWSKAFDEDNCAPTCTKCHSRIESMNKRGQDTKNIILKAKKANYKELYGEGG